MATPKSADDPWCAAVFRRPRKVWWAPAVLWFVLVFSFDRLLFGKSNAEALAWAAGLSAVYALVDYFAWRRRRV